MRMVSSAIPIITFRYDPYKRKKLTFWVSLFAFTGRKSPIFAVICCSVYLNGMIFTVPGISSSSSGVRWMIRWFELPRKWS